MIPNMSTAKIKTRILIISDTHGAQPYTKPPPPSPMSCNSTGRRAPPDTEDELTSPAADLIHIPTGFRDPLPDADVAIHCGDLTRRSTVAEFARTFTFLSALRAPLKLAIAGNHDLALDPAHWFAGYDNNSSSSDVSSDADTEYRAVQDIVARARANGVRYLPEGTHHFTLANGARLALYASPYTPVYGGWAFQYPPGTHVFRIPPRVDVAVTHGPPLGVLDGAGLAQLRGLPPDHHATDRAGCDALFRAVHAARPQVHCFGHIHEAWGGYLAAWRHPPPPPPGPSDAAHDGTPGYGGASPMPATWQTAIDADASELLLTARQLKPQTRADLHTVRPEQVQRLVRLSRQRCVRVDLTGDRGDGDDDGDGDGIVRRLEKGRQTFFVNAAIMDVRYRPSQLPWLVDLELPRAESSDVAEDAA
ncbi:metallophosphoesterase domain-containing protein [Purpureocillium lavendulum]|uniref:Metallophosphoesterase domain-containing protein n=1 Tax=Purpureocillium lavendulum TaxID=1247861 RepID=A0AB34FZ10_9HYPO|nr:metallophosphoesterase domain-containing protein [Purpureocillium lavendulum]